MSNHLEDAHVKCEELHRVVKNLHIGLSVERHRRLDKDVRHDLFWARGFVNEVAELR